MAIILPLTLFVPPWSVVWARRLPLLLLLLPNKYRRVQLLGKRLRRNQARLFLFPAVDDHNGAGSIPNRRRRRPPCIYLRLAKTQA